MVQFWDIVILFLLPIFIPPVLHPWTFSGENALPLPLPPSPSPPTSMSRLKKTRKLFKMNKLCFLIPSTEFGPVVQQGKEAAPLTSRTGSPLRSTSHTIAYNLHNKIHRVKGTQLWPGNDLALRFRTYLLWHYETQKHYVTINAIYLHKLVSNFPF